MTIRNFFGRIRNRARSGKRNPRPALNELDVKLDRYLDFRNGFFIEAGANDGYSQSNTYFLEMNRGWSGILVEGIPDLYEQCRKNRARSVTYNCALVSDTYTQSSVTMRYANLMSVVDGSLRSEEKQAKHIRDGIDIQKLRGSYSVDVPARTLESILCEFHGLPHIDFFSLDVEGSELGVLQGLNLSRYRPTFILVEANFYDEINALLQANGYSQLEKLSYHDYLYKDSRTGDARPPIDKKTDTA